MVADQDRTHQVEVSTTAAWIRSRSPARVASEMWRVRRRCFSQGQLWRDRRHAPHRRCLRNRNFGINSSNTASAYQTSDVQRDVFPAEGTSITSMEKDGAPQAQGKPRWFLTQFLSTSRPAGVCSSTKTEDSYACSQESSTSAAISLDEKKLLRRNARREAQQLNCSVGSESECSSESSNLQTDKGPLHFIMHFASFFAPRMVQQ